ncbi:MAG: protoporphyrinogen oxidase [Vicinamibacterales bacterium]|nr:protoporphyrinogen oxidase [Vicinamibacterales bacterium]
MTLDAIIVGGGIAGLAAAYELNRRGASFVVLERASRPGGVIVSEELDGFTIDAGPDSLLIQKSDGIKLCQELGLGDRLVSTLPPRLGFIQRRGKLYSLPAASVLGIPTRIGPFVRTGLFSWRAKLRMGAELFVPRRGGANGSDESIGAFMTRRFGREATTYLAEPLLAGIHAGDVDRLSLGALFPLFADAENKHGSLIRAFRRRRARPSTEGAFKSLPGGLSEMVRALVNTLPVGSVQTNAAVTHIGRTARDQAFRVEMIGGIRHECRALILSTPAYVTAALMRDRDAEIARLCEEIPYSSIATVALAFRREDVAHPLNGSGYVVPRTESSGILAATWLSSKWPHRAPEGKVLLRTFIGGARDPGALAQSDAELVARSLAAIRPVLGIGGDPLLTRVYRFDRASAQHEVGHLDRMMAIDRRLGAHPGLFLTGSGFRGVGIPDCVADARATAAKVVDWLGT